MNKFRLFFHIFALISFCGQALSAEPLENINTNPQTSAKLLAKTGLQKDDTSTNPKRKFDTVQRVSEDITQKPTKKVKQDISQDLEQSSKNKIELSQKPEDKFLTLFNNIMKKGPHPIEAISGNTGKKEDLEGSRKWVKFFDRENDTNKSHLWHVSSAETIKAVRIINDNKQYLPVETNFSIARLTFVLQDGKQQEENIPFFFVSGWPANNNTNKAQEFSKALSEEKLGQKLKDFKEYGLRFITMSFKGITSEDLQARKYQWYQNELSNLFKDELLNESLIISKLRLQSHINVMTASDNMILAKLYFHSEQSLRLYVKGAIERFKEDQKKQSMSDIRSYSTLKPSNPIQYVILDTCSFYDMCWCCGDTLVSCAHTLNFGEEVIIRASGCKAYFDTPLSTGSNSLRYYKEDFLGFAEGKAYELKPTYKPYVAHAAVDNL